MKPEPSVEEPIPASSSTKGGAGAAPTSKSTGASQKSAFLWKTCTDLVERDRVDIKQQAVLDGLRLGEKLSSILKNRINGQNQGLGAEELADWAQQFANVRELYEAPHSTIGLIGAVGSGKSTLLNALLGEQDLLPSSNDGPGTASACRVVYNHGPDGYRAKISFRNRQSFTDELDVLFQDLSAKRELQARVKEDIDDDERQEIEDQLEIIDTNTSQTLETLNVVFEVTEEDLGVTSTGEFLDAHPLDVLGTTVEIAETDRETFLAKTKQYMFSIPGDYEGEELIRWPLVQDVVIFVKSDILRYGIELVDLPGLGDAVEARSRVTETFSQPLDITAIVAPAIRATEERTVIGFIKRRQEDEMRMNGKFDRDSLCVIISKSEDMDLNVHLAQKAMAKDYPTIPKHLARLKMLDKIVRTAESGLSVSESEALGRHNATTGSHSGEVEANRAEFLSLRESLIGAAVSIRNRSISERIQKEFRGRQAATRSSKDDYSYADTVKVFPTSARAFQQVRHPGGGKAAGFPTEMHTGIPRFKQWLLEVTFKKREKNLDAILNQLSSLFVKVQTWISMNEDVTATPTAGLHNIDSVHERHRRSLTALLRQSCEELRQVEPLKAKETALAICQKRYPGKIDRWRYRYPEKNNSALKLSVSTQSCILRKNGDYHQSRGAYSHEYQWIDDLATVFIDEVFEDWKHTFLNIVPGYEVKIQESLEHVWQRYKIALDSFCREHNASHLATTGKVQRAIENAEEHLVLGAHMTLRDLRHKAQSVHPIFRQEIQRFMTLVFGDAYAIKGQGCMRKRDELLKRFATKRSADMPVKACEKMEAALAKLIQQQVTKLEGLADGAVLRVETQMRLLLGMTNTSSTPTARKKQKRLAAEISPHLTSWKLCWQKPSSQRDDHVMRGDLSIPDPELLKIKDGEDGV